MSDSTDAMLRLLGMIPLAAQQKMVGLYRETLASQLAALGQALQAEPPTPAAQALAHKIAGSAAMMQDAALAGAARGIEGALVAADAAQARARWPEVQRFAAETMAALATAYP
ncbi:MULTISPECIES: Hpt domain-containing protein [Ramlibacter]|uniref:Hpt domain-containing protein n=1 Tax=Ramlibacter aquaticus TaxID=2780094 RepID=A0ABR9SBY1_9BURK|nr:MULTISPECIES: Hpt domain-containing protein [Ramlibacter]MBE7939287.1 Hpt domain-containing protein [Ramlibacter aquaticus]